MCNSLYRFNVVRANQAWQSTIRFGVSIAVSFVVVVVVAAGSASSATASESVDYETDVAPIFNKHCNSCHNADDLEGSLSLESFAALEMGGDNGAAIVAGKPQESRLFLMVTGEGDSMMPPDDAEPLDKRAIEILRRWIEGGARGPSVSTAPSLALDLPTIEPQHSRPQPITSVSWSPSGEQVAVARFGSVEIVEPESLTLIRRLTGFPGKVNSVAFSADGNLLVTASGVVGLRGEATVWDVASGDKLGVFSGHRDTLYDALLSPSRKTLATASYDQKIILWDVTSGSQQHVIEGHKDAVYDLEFHPEGELLASASGDQSLKLWNVSSGIRLDTLGQPLTEQFAVAVTPDGRFVLGGGSDHRIRVWRVASTDKPKINPLIYSRYAHEGSITQLAISPDGKWLISIADDNNIKVWETKTYTQVDSFEVDGGMVTSLAFSPDSESYLLGSIDGTLDRRRLNKERFSHTRSGSDVEKADTDPMPTGDASKLSEKEPNNLPENALLVELPAKIDGIISAASTADTSDVDLYRFDSGRGQSWMIEINAARSNSPLDSRVEILDATGTPVKQILLRAVRDSYFTFRGKDSDTNDDFRLHNWEEMELNEYLYCNGEVVRLWLYPRGPDSGFQVYPGEGSRHAYFGTTPTSHALQEPCFIVEPLPADVELEEGGAPVFPIYFENDDDSLRRWGKDSRLMFTAPDAGEYLVRVSDVRGFGGPEFKYELTLRPARPDFKVKLSGANPKVPAGSGREFKVTAERIDGFDGAITIDVTGLPDGFHVSSPIVIEAGQISARATLYAASDAAAPTEEAAAQTVVTATADINGETMSHQINNLGKIELVAAKPKVRVVVVPNDHPPVKTQEDFETLYKQYVDSPLELDVRPGETISATVLVHREGLESRIPFGKQDSGRNLPHGVIVDNIGLNGLMIVEGQSERRFFLTAAKWVPKTSRMFHLQAQVDGNHTSLPVILNVTE